MATKADIKRQIEELQAKLAQQPPSPPAKRRKVDDGNVLAPATPSPRKKRNTRYDREQSPTATTRRSQQSRIQQVPPLEGSSKTNSSHRHEATSSHYVATQAPEPSALFSQLKSLSANTTDHHELITRTEGFSEKPTPKYDGQTTAPTRDENLAIVEELEVGPSEHKPIADDPQFERLEPNSGIRLKQRILSHDALQDHLTGRYFLPPSLLYSVVRLQPNKQAYEVPVYGDWVTIAVVAERGEVRLTSGPGNSTHGKREGDEGDFGETDGKRKAPNKNGENKGKTKKDDGLDDDENPRKGGKKYVHLKLIDLGSRSRSSSSSTPRATLRGDAQLSLLLFESDYFDKVISTEKGKRKEQKIWRGGSGGAFEECFSKLREGTVVALLNPKVLKPFQNTKNPSNSTILALTPPSASAVAIIGYALDLGMCTVAKRDGKPCRAWVDKRTNSGSSRTGEDVCEYHIQHAVQRVRASRPEFAIGTSGMSATAAKARPTYDPKRQWGLKPEGPAARGADGEAMYIIGGHVASSSRAQAPGIAAESIGREGQAKARRRVAQRDDDVLKTLLSRANGRGSNEDGEGVPMSRDALEIVRRAKEAVKIKEKQVNAKQKKKDSAKADDAESSGEDENGSLCPEAQCKRIYSAEMIKRLGFDPLLNAYGMRPGQGNKQTGKANIIADKLDDGIKKGREVKLGPPPGAKVRSGVKAPVEIRRSEPADTESCLRGKSAEGTKTCRPSHRIEDNSDSDLEIESPPKPRPRNEEDVNYSDELESS